METIGAAFIGISASDWAYNVMQGNYDNVTLDTEGQNMMFGWLFGDDNRTMDEMGAALEQHMVKAQATITWQDIPFGPDHAPAMAALLGPNPQCIAAVVYEQPTRHAYALADGRYAIVTTTQYGYSSHVTLYPDYATYQQTWNATLAAVPDVEGGIRRGTCPGTREKPVNGACSHCGYTQVFIVGRSKGLLEPH